MAGDDVSPEYIAESRSTLVHCLDITSPIGLATAPGVGSPADYEFSNALDEESHFTTIAGVISVK